jgi:anti-sigma regulatory factor (Ser/Thr protein kinase)
MPRPYRPEDVRYFDKIDLAAIATAVTMSRSFTRFVLLRWGAPWLIEDATVVISELVTNAVKHTGLINQQPNYATLPKLKLISVRLVGLENSIVFEVWDTSDDVPVLQDAGPEAEGGRGLYLIQSLSHQWGYYPVQPGKVVWAELPVHAQVNRNAHG